MCRQHYAIRATVWFHAQRVIDEPTRFMNCAQYLIEGAPQHHLDTALLWRARCGLGLDAQI
jgi:hypothetical protein